MEVRGKEHLDAVVEAHGRIIVAFWHETLGLAAWYFRNKGYTTLISQSYDGELATRLIRRFGFNIARGSSTRGGFEALGDLRKALRHPPGLGFTVDGPKGPRREAKPGIVILSSLSHVPITVVACAARPAWRLHSWDRFVIPKPKGEIVVSFGEPIPPPADRTPEALEATRLQVEQSLNRLHADLNDPL
jgi:lysophospholipid acyltransferase (LPLAT)-like uncharacterized protein